MATEQNHATKGHHRLAMGHRRLAKDLRRVEKRPRRVVMGIHHAALNNRGAAQAHLRVETIPTP